MYELKIKVERKWLVDKIKRIVTKDNDDFRNTKRALEKCGGNRRQAAEFLGLSKRTIVRRVKKYGLK